jgi:hypothetical protein
MLKQFKNINKYIILKKHTLPNTANSHRMPQTVTLFTKLVLFGNYIQMG